MAPAFGRRLTSFTSVEFGSSVPCAIKSPPQLPPYYPLTDALERITKCAEDPLNDIKLLDLKVRASFKTILAQADEDLGAALSANIKAVSARPEDEFELKFVRKKGKKLIDQAVPAALIDGIRRLARRPDLRDQVLFSRWRELKVQARVWWTFCTSSSQLKRA